MRRSWLSALVCSALLTAAMLAGPVSPARAASHPVVGHPAAKAHNATHKAEANAVRAGDVVLNCAGKPLSRPRTFTLSCADHDNSLTGLRWMYWAHGMATASGTQRVDGCMPDCASGKFESYPVRVVLWDSAKAAGQPRESRYTMITLLYQGKRPPMRDGDHGRGMTGPLWG